MEKITFQTSGGYGPDLKMSFYVNPNDTDMPTMVYYIRQWLLAYGFSEGTVDSYISDPDPTFSHWDSVDE